MLLVIGLHALPDLFHNFCSIDSALCLEIIPFGIVLFSYDNHLENHQMSATHIGNVKSGADLLGKSSDVSC